MSNFLFPHPDKELQGSLDAFLDLIEKTQPLPGRFRSQLPRDVADLSHSLTDQRSDRDDGYLGKPAQLSAYLRYFLPWNLYRLVRLLPSLPLNLKDGDAITDLGSGPLTVPIALWLSRPELRSLHLEFRCLDRTGKVLEAGNKLFAALVVGTNSPWKIRTIRGSLGARIDGPKAALVTAANVLNELFWDDRSAIAEQAGRKAVFLSALARDDGQILIVEPGIPRSGTFVSALRTAFMPLGRKPLSPCPHVEACPLSGGKKGAKWCHFAFDTEDAPARLHKLSTLAHIPKERATLSFLLAGNSAAAQPVSSAPSASTNQLSVRVVSDSFALPDGSSGRYACSARGLILISGSRRTIEEAESGILLSFANPQGAEKRDEKSGALVLKVST